VAVIRLGAYADYEDDDQRRAQLPDAGVESDALKFALRGARRQVSIGIEQYAILSDGRRVVFDRPGFTTGVAGADDSWAAYLTADDIEDDVRTTLQPETERAGDPALDFPHIARCLSALGVETSADELIKVPHSIELSERLRIRLAG
jgi:hypothetical protein